MKKSTLIMILSLVLAVAIGVGSTMAYLQDTDEDVNVMTLGSVYITQNEQEYNEAGELVPFTQDKPLYPAVGTPAWNLTDESTEADKAWRQFAGMENVVDKYVTVTNTGKSDAYVRTLVALEMGELDINAFADVFGLSANKVDGDEFDFPGTWEIVDDEVYTINGKTYNVMTFEHQDALVPGETTIPSILQMYLKGEATTNETMEKIDGNANGKYDVLVLSQAVQTQGFANASTALNTAFGEINQDNVQEWFANIGDNIGTPGEDWPNNNPPIIPDDATVVTKIDELKAAIANKDKLIYVDEGSYDFGGKYSIPEGTTIFGMDNDRVEFKGTLTSTLKNLTFENIRFAGSDALRWAYPSGTLTFKNCEFEPTGVYAVHFDGTNADVLFEDCRIIGWAAMAGGSGHLTFKNCEVIGDGWYGVLRCFADADVIDCTFDVDNVNKEDVYQDGLHAVGCTINVVNCTNVNGTMQDLVNVSNGGVINIQ